MAKPSVTCSADVFLRYDSSGIRPVSLGAAATNSPTSWRWTILDAPEDSGVMSGIWGDFTDGVATIQNPTLNIDSGIDGTFVIQCAATNIDGDSDPAADQANGQQLIVVRIESDLMLPGDYAYDWGKKLLIPSLRRITKSLGGLQRNTRDLLPNKHYIDGINGDDTNDGLSWAWHSGPWQLVLRDHCRCQNLCF